MEVKTTQALQWIVGILNEHEIQYQITGGLAAKLYGSARNLNDIDIDIPEIHFETILPQISQYIIEGPARYNDGKWDGEFITLNYQGQEIDIGGIGTLRISNKERTKWIPYANHSLDTQDIQICSLIVKVILPQKLIEYKKELDGDHQQIDIRAAEEYLTHLGST
jgi:hypothetical protein